MTNIFITAVYAVSFTSAQRGTYRMSQASEFYVQLANSSDVNARLMRFGNYGVVTQVWATNMTSIAFQPNRPGDFFDNFIVWYSRYTRIDPITGQQTTVFSEFRFNAGYFNLTNPREVRVQSNGIQPVHIMQRQ
jgi:hypothetical protein